MADSNERLQGCNSERRNFIPNGGENGRIHDQKEVQDDVASSASDFSPPCHHHLLIRAANQEKVDNRGGKAWSKISFISRFERYPLALTIELPQVLKV
eukprot:scaffold1830_cov117-Cylindrotheca_fusiformis.AAC.4